MLAACLPFAWMWVLPSSAKDFSQSLVSVTAFASNIFFLFTSDYFNSAEGFKPLLHTWSLAVEEQFYVFFPLLLMLICRSRKQVLLTILAILALASLVAAQLLVHSQPSATFYGLHTRGWELLIGSLCAIFVSTDQYEKITPALRQYASLTGLALIALALFCFDKHTPFPSLYTLVPTVGAALLILYASPATWAGRLLASKALVGVGLVSYSAYLWHQPLFALMRHRNAAEPSPEVFSALVVATMVLAWFSWKYVEHPFRSRAQFTRKNVFVFGIAGSIVFAAAGLAGHFTNGFLAQRTTPEQLAVLKTAQASPLTKACHMSRRHVRPPADACEYQEGKLEWAAFGDSHAVELAYATAQQLQPQGIKLKHFSFSSCHPTYGTRLAGEEACSDWTSQVVQYIVNQPNIHTVMVSYRIHSELFGPHDYIYPRQPNEVSESIREQRWAAYVNVLRRFVQAGKQVILVLPAPELASPIDKLVIHAANPAGAVTGISRAWWNQRSRYVMDRLAQLPPEVRIVDATRIFCGPDVCYAAKNGIAYYYDNHHMSLQGAALVAAEVIKAAGQQPGADVQARH